MYNVWYLVVRVDAQGETSNNVRIRVTSEVPNSYELLLNNYRPTMAQTTILHLMPKFRSTETIQKALVFVVDGG